MFNQSEFINELHQFLSSEYGLSVKNTLPAKRGFYAETWDIQTESGRYFLKIDHWNHHKDIYRRSLPVIQYMTNHGISFIPKIVKTKNFHLCSGFRQGIAAVFEYIPGELVEDCPIEQLYGSLAKIYRLRTDGVELDTETFGVERFDTFQDLRDLPELPDEVRKALAEKEATISRYTERLKMFSSVCKNDRENFHITHGDAGGNCILHDNQLFLVDWDSCLLAPIERDAWTFIYDHKKIEKINSVLAQNGVSYRLEQNRLCYYCYDFFFHYLNEHLKSIADTKNKELKEMLSRSLTEYPTNSWIYKRLEAADACCPDKNCCLNVPE